MQNKKERTSLTTKINETLTKKEEDLHFENGFHLTSYHERDCCESVYASFKEAEDTIWKASFNISKDTNLKDIVEIVPDYGIRLKDINGCLHNIPCYDIQNGYYSSDLELQLLDKEGNLISELDITDASQFIDC